VYFTRKRQDEGGMEKNARGIAGRREEREALGISYYKMYILLWYATMAESRLVLLHTNLILT